MSRRSRRRRRPRRRVHRTTQHASLPIPQAAVAIPEASFREEYRYVLADLKRIAALAAVMLVILVGLSLLLP